MQRIIVFICLSYGLLFAESGDLFNGASDPVMVHNVNVITGRLQLGFVDAVIEGAAALALKRSYTNLSDKQENVSKWQFAGGWSFFSHAHLYLELANHKYWAKIVESSGGLVSYEEESKTSNLIIMKPYVKEDQNSDVMSFRSDSKNNRLHLDRINKIAILYLADGGKRVYKRYKRSIDWLINFKGYYKGLGSEYLLQEEISSSGQRTIYQYSDDKKTLTVQSVNVSGKKIFSEIVIQEKKQAPKFNIKAITSDGQVFNYEAKEKNGKLTSISSNLRAAEDITYIKRTNLRLPWLKTICFPRMAGLEVEYYLPKDKESHTLQNEYKVKRIFEAGLNVASFDFKDGETLVYDINNTLTKYHHENHSISKIERFDKNKVLYSEEIFVWEGGNLVCKKYLDGAGGELFSKSFKYDEFKNLIEETVFGKFDESYTKSYRYNNKHLLIEGREESGLSYNFEYLEGTDLITVKRSMDGDRLLLEESFIYDEDLLLVEKRVFDGHRETYERWQRDKESGLIVKSDNGMDQSFYEYDKNKKLIKQGNKFNEILISYDKKGRMNGHCFSSGSKTDYKVDDFGNIIEIKEVGSVRKRIKYNLQNLPIFCTMNGKISSNTYNGKGKVLTEKNSNGELTAFTYDEFGRVIKKTLPEVLDENGKPYCPEFKYEYDVEGNVIAQTDPAGYITRSKYNVFKKPIQTVFPDGSKILNSYYSNGELKESTNKDGAKTTYEYDLLNRLILKKSELFEERWEYEGRVLKSYSDPSGLITNYEYDEFLRKISEDCEGRKKEFLYDAMGYLCERRSGELFSTEVHDSLGRIIQTSENGFNKISYEYDKEGRKKKAIKHTSDGDFVDEFFWDDEGSLIKHTDPFGGETEIVYEKNRRTSIDPIGNRSTEVFDALKRVVRKEKRSKDGELLFAENFFYDRGGNLKKRFTEEHDLEVEYFYDCMGRVILEIESVEKRTSFKYDSKGRLSSKIMPNGVLLNYEYDSLDRMVQLKSSDRSVWYEYIYTGLDLTKIKDLILGKTLERCYTKFHELAEETGLHGFKTSWYYDLYGRKKEVYLPDGSSIAYSYKDSFMSKVSRFDKDKKLLYQHEYTKFDLNHHVQEENLPFGFGQVKTKRDSMERPVSMISPFHEIGLSFGLSNLVTKKVNSINGDKDYSYDNLNQLTAEGETLFDFDSLGNPKEYEVNKLCQIVSTDLEKLSYDPNGNLILRNNTVYKYDALNRLTCIKYETGRKVTFTYDPLSRLVSKNEDFFIYDGDFEIGKINKDGKILQLKVLGLGVKGDIGAAIMLEFEDKAFIPLHDLQGNIVAMLNRLKNVVETYDFNAFGETKRSFYFNPWRYGSKRVEEGLIFYGKRFYDPKLKRWISPDPMGFADSRNPYQFVLNDPLNRLDQFGLEIDLYFSTDKSSRYKHYMPELSYSMDTYKSRSESFPTAVEHRGTASFPDQTMQLSIICSRAYSFTFSDEEKSNGYFNYMDHLPDLLKGAENQIAIVSFMNGICNAPKDWHSMGHSIAGAMPQGTLIIGLYNPTNGFCSDFRRAIKVRNGLITPSAINLACFFHEMKAKLNSVSPNAKMLHICHSEACPIFNFAFEMLLEDDKKWVQKHVYVLAFAPLRCVPKAYGLNPINFYSVNDAATARFAETDMEKYNVKWLNITYSRTNKVDESFLAHGFGEKIYQGALKNEIENFQNKKEGFYVGIAR